MRFIDTKFLTFSTTVFVASLTSSFLAAPALGQAATKQDATNVKFARQKIKVGSKIVSVEVADTFERRAQGLMYRTKLAEGEGMLFVFGQEDMLAFWMKNTLIPLAIGYFDKDQQLVDVQEMVPAVAGEASPKTYPAAKPAMFALEMPKGWFSKNKIGPGARFTYLK